MSAKMTVRGRRTIEDRLPYHHTYRIKAAELLNLLPEQPQVERLVVDCRDRNTRVPRLLVVAIQLFEIVDLCAGRGLD